MVICGLINNENKMKINKYSIFFSLFFSVAFGVQANPSLLIKLPTRSRPEQFFKNLDVYYQKLSGEVPYRFLITCDSDDITMNCPQVIQKLQNYPHLNVIFSNNSSKVEAVNKDIDTYKDWTILLVASDDMEPIVDGYDKIIVQRMLEAFPYYDGVLNFNDGHVGAACNTLPVIGRKFYDRFMYVYNPAYKSLYCNEELTTVSRMLNKEKVCDEILLKHNHPVWGCGTWDELYAKNEQYKAHDYNLFIARRAHNFYLPASLLCSASEREWSILLYSYSPAWSESMCIFLEDQIKKYGLGDTIEIVYCSRDIPESAADHRNLLVRQSKGRYISFIDEGDNVAADYIKLIYDKLKEHPDCVSITALMPGETVYCPSIIYSVGSLQHRYYQGNYYYPLSCINPIKRHIVLQLPFYNGWLADQNWAQMISASGLLKHEVAITEPCYFYLTPVKVLPLERREFNNLIDVFLFADDRPSTLATTLTSLQYYLKGVRNIFVLHKHESGLKEIEYKSLSSQFKGNYQVVQLSCKESLLDLLRTASNSVVFVTNAIALTQHIDLTMYAQELVQAQGYVRYILQPHNSWCSEPTALGMALYRKEAIEKEIAALEFTTLDQFLKVWWDRLNS